VGDGQLERPGPGERLSALVALIALAVAIAIVGVGAAANWQGLVITVIGLFVIVVGGWYVVSRRGVARSVAMLTTLMGVVLLIAGFIVADLSILAVVLVAVLAILSVGAARYALRESTETMRERVGSRTRSRPPATPC